MMLLKKMEKREYKYKQIVKNKIKDICYYKIQANRMINVSVKINDIKRDM